MFLEVQCQRGCEDRYSQTLLCVCKSVQSLFEGDLATSAKVLNAHTYPLT